MFNTAPCTAVTFGFMNVKLELFFLNLKSSQVSWKERRKGLRNWQKFTLFYKMELALPCPNPFFFS